MHDPVSEQRPRGELLVNVKRIAVTGKAGKTVNVLGRYCVEELGLVADLNPFKPVYRDRPLLLFAPQVVRDYFFKNLWGHHLEGFTQTRSESIHMQGKSQAPPIFAYPMEIRDRKLRAV